LFPNTNLKSGIPGTDAQNCQTKKQKMAARTKLIVRGLPPLLTQEQFLESLKNFKDEPSFFYYLPGKQT
jgi:hypothetical protein